jgi:hypothetical protein
VVFIDAQFSGPAVANDAQFGGDADNTSADGQITRIWPLRKTAAK